jgi:prepilin-type N-terminal cleavage/methylation domain-containing protein
MKKQSGFSLIELMTVIIIIGIMVGIAVPSIIRNLPQRRLVEGRDQVLHDLMILRQRSINEDRCFGLVSIAGDLTQYQSFEDVNRNGAFDGGELVLNPSRLPTGVAFTANFAVSFLPSGALSQPIGSQVTFVNAKGQNESFQILFSGMVFR